MEQWLSATTPVSNWILVAGAFLIIVNGISSAIRLFGPK